MENEKTAAGFNCHLDDKAADGSAKSGRHKAKAVFSGLSKEEFAFALRLIAGIALLAISRIHGVGGAVRTIFGIAAFALCGADIVLEALHNISEKDFFSENVLMSVAGIVALSIGETVEAVMVMTLSGIGEMLQEKAVERSRGIVTGLLNMRPDKARVVGAGGVMNEVPVAGLKVGDVILVKPGERIAADGVVTGGESTLDTSPITGESMPRSCAPGTNVMSGYVNLSDTLTVRVTTEYSQSTVSRIVKLVEEAENNKGKTELLIRRFCRIYTPAVFAAALIIGVLVPLIGRLSFAVWLHRALVLLVVSCPCAIVISVPLTYFAGIGGASRNGVLFKNANSIDNAAKLTSVVFDKTGTLTTGRFSVVAVDPVRISADELLFLASYAEAFSNHPIARSILQRSGVRVDTARILKHHEEKGKGSIVRLSGSEDVAAGNAEFMDTLGVKGSFVSTGSTSVYVAVGKTYVGRIDLADTVKNDSAKAVSELRQLGVDNVALMTGDNALAATNVGRAVGITEIYSDCLPQDKAERLKYVLAKQAKDDRLAFVGDGINDVPVLALADVGIAMGGVGSDAAIDTADVVIMTDEPSKVASAVRSAKLVRRLAAENIAFALSVKLVTMVLGVMGLAAMWMAVFADVGVALLAIANSMRAFKKF